MKMLTAVLASGLLLIGSAVTLHADEAAAPATAPAAGATHSKGAFAKKHPRRAQVNQRLKKQDKRIRKEVKEGEMTKAEAKTLHKEHHAIRQEERDMAKQNGGKITKGEQKVLNQQENKVSKEIGK